jgi:hypothetical protein
VGQVAERPASAATLRDALSLKEAVTLRHLQYLSHVGLVSQRRNGTEVEYFLDIEKLEELKRELFARPRAEPAETPEEEILARFVRDGRLQKIPERPEKLRIVAAWLAEQFERGVEYPEREVNRILQQHHPDHATFRRLLVDEGFMERRAGIYWRSGASLNG